MKIQIIGLPGSGKTTIIKKYLKMNKDKHIKYLDYAHFKNKNKLLEKINKLNSYNLIIESACGMILNNTSIIKYDKPISEIYTNFSNREGYLDEDYISLLESKMIPAKYTVRTDNALYNILDTLFLKELRSI